MFRERKRVEQFSNSWRDWIFYDQIGKIDIKRELQTGGINKALISDEWLKDEFGNSILSIPNLFVKDTLTEKRYPFEICLPEKSKLIDDQQGLKTLLEYSMGIKKPLRLLDNANFSTAVYFKHKDILLAGVYMKFIDITGPERLIHNELLRNNGCPVIPSYFSTTNFYSSLYTDGIIPSEKECVEVIALLNKTRDKLISEGKWLEDIRIDGSDKDIRMFAITGKKVPTSVDPTFRHMKFESG
ncbi:MAG: hypothetical protein UT39_C0001G0040 [Candidatus Woesebacteria bacterium GW2011_GWA1_39_21]|uniref:Uncharacterized protein n=1 Tax=Candidatus Woesebacteria bacterium GW2011_GWA1_39_21 TaxID=1618550 RepID=A0A0G0QNM2_9BACT|nr:MAG: hypothetical protein UT39_C0001G0040 [Candidatus Woesebacteria bacterium GW2011_GWA1_39_21]